MATTRNFQDMLNEYLPNKLLREELLKRDWFLNNVEKDDKWKGGKVIVPFKAAGSSSIKMGGLTGATDISQDKFVRGSIDDYVECWGSMIFNHRDLMDHSGRVVEDSFLKILPDLVDDFADFMKMIVSIQLGTGPTLANVTDDTNALTGRLVVDRIDRFMLDQKITLDDDDSPAASYYVIAIDVNSDELTLSATRGGAAADVSAYSVAQNAVLLVDGGDTTQFQNLKDALLSAANGGSATLHGQTKLAYPFLQAVNVDGSSITAANLLQKLMESYTEVRKRAKGRADTFLMSYKHFGSVLQAIENKTNGAANWQISVEDKKASLYGWDEVVINTVKGKLKIVAIQEWEDATIPLLDMRAFTFRSNGMFKKRKSPEGLEYFEVRNTTGYQYIVDMSLFGELEVAKPGHCGIIHSISY